MSTNPLKHFSDIITSYQPPTTGTSTRSPTTKNNNFSRRCLQCQREIVDKNNFSPYCSSSCMDNHDKGVKIDHKGSEKNTMLGFSEVFK